MKNSPSALHYNAPAEPKVSKRMLLIVFAGVIVLAGILIAIVH